VARLGRGQPNRPLLNRRAAGPRGGTGTINVAFTATGSGTKHAAGTGTINIQFTATGSGTKDAPGTGTVEVAFTPTGSGIKSTGIGLPARPRPRWQLLIGPASGGYEYSLSEARGRRMAFKLDEADDLAFTLDGRHPLAEAVDELSTDVHAIWTGDNHDVRLLSRCRVGNTSDDYDEDGHDMQVTGLDYRAVLNTRLLWSNSQLIWAATDQAEIVWGLIQQTQLRAGGDLGISKAWAGTTPTGVLLDRTFEVGDKIGERVSELAERIGGFDWDLTPVSASALELEVWAERGVDRGVVLETGGLVTKGRREVNVSPYANAIRYTGSSDPVTSPVEAEAVGLAQLPEGRWEAVFGDDGLNTQAALDDRAAWQLATSQVLQPVYTMTLKPGAWGGPDHIWLGDPVRVIPRSGRLRRVDARLRVYEITVTLGESGEETVEVTVGGRRPDYRRRPAAVERRLKKLELR
jgi:hypothetical protein